MQKYSLTLTLTEPMLGTVPADPEVYRAYIETKKPKSLNDEDESATVVKREKAGWTTFHCDPTTGILFIYDYMIKGMLKNAAQVLGDGKYKERQAIENLVFVFPRRIYLGTKKPHGVLERPLRAMTMQGPRVSVTRSDMIKAGTKLSCELVVINEGTIKIEDLKKLLDYGSYKGIGQFRNGGYGRFTYTLKTVKEGR